ncbi:MAG: tetratricopeptide repeat protein [Acidobacteria bacterium]|nr:tetratricopeptide repeat protein [Acidobacteriota bacterium]
MNSWVRGSDIRSPEGGRSDCDAVGAGTRHPGSDPLPPKAAGRRAGRRPAPLAAALFPLLLLPAALGAQPEATATESVRGLLDQARALASRNEADAAAEALGRAVALAPNSEDVLNAYARFSLARGNPIQATLALEPLARMHPGEAEYAYLLGVARMQVGEMAEAAEALFDAAALDRNRALTHIALGLALNRVDRFDEAREALATALRLEPDNVEALAAMSETTEGLGMLAEASRLAERALAVNPDHPTALVTIGTARLKEGRFEAAREALTRAVVAEPDSIKGHYQLSLALARLGDREAAERHLRLSREAQAAIEEHIERLRAQPPLGSRTEP